MVDAICEELIKRKEYLTESVGTIYFGGGTPSLLSYKELQRLLDTISQNFDLEDQLEITLEANPEDLSLDKTRELMQLGINRLSIGIQTFDSKKLNWMNRIHTRDQVFEGFQHARQAGFSNISLDLIYALPDAGFNYWESDLTQVSEMNPEHISLYGLTIEERTVFGHREKKGELISIPDDDAAKQYLYAIEFLKSKGYDHYEVSNFGKEGFYSRHNHSYWSGVPYLGVGPGAHSFNGHSRQMNVRNNPRYLKEINSDSYFEVEELSNIQLLNEQILTSLRTSRGLSIEMISSKYGVDLTDEYGSLLEELIDQKLIEIESDYIRLLPNGFLVADEIALRLFFPE